MDSGYADTALETEIAIISLLCVGSKSDWMNREGRCISEKTMSAHGRIVDQADGVSRPQTRAL